MASEGIVRLLLDNSAFNSKLKQTKSELGGMSETVLTACKSVLKLGSAFGATMSAGEALRKSIEATEASHDAYAKTLQICTDVTNSFFVAMSNGSFDGFISGLENVISHAREAYEAMDDLGSFTSRYNPWAGAVRTQIQTLISEARALKANGKTGEANSKLAQATQLQSTLKGATTNLGQKQVKGAVSDLNSLLSNATNGKLVASSAMLKQLADPSRWKETNRMASEYQKQMKQIKSLEAQAAKEASRGAYGRVEAGTTLMQADAIKNSASFKRNMIAYKFQNLRDDTTSAEGQRFNQALNNIYGDIQAKAMNDATDALISRTSARVNKTSGGGGHKGGGGTSVSVRKAQQLQESIDKFYRSLQAAPSEDAIADAPTAWAYMEEQNRQAGLNSAAGIAAPGMGEEFSGMPAFETGSIEEYTQKLRMLNEELNTLAIGSERYNEVAGQINDTQNELDTKKAKAMANAGDDNRKSWSYATQALNSAGQAMKNIGDTNFNIAGTIAMGIANVVSGLMEAFAKDKSSNSNVWAKIAAGVAATAEMIAMISSIHSATGYAEGGVVGGNSYAGDRLYARLNSGEVVLNQTQAARANAALDSAGGGGQGYVSGENIYIAMNNYGRRTGRGELVFSRR